MTEEQQLPSGSSATPPLRSLSCPPVSKPSLKYFPEVKPVSRRLITSSFVVMWLGGLLSVAGMVLLPFFLVTPKEKAELAFQNIRMEQVAGKGVVAGDDVGIQTAAPAPILQEGSSHGSSTQLTSSLESSPVVLAVIAVMLIMGLFVLPYTIVGFVVLYRGWKCLQPLRVIAPKTALDMPSAGMAVGLLFVPFYCLYWMFRAYRGVEKYGRQLSDFSGCPYRGPSSDLAQTVPVLRLITWCLAIIPFISFLAIFVGLAEAIVSYRYILKVNDMVTGLGRLPETCSAD